MTARQTVPGGTSQYNLSITNEPIRRQSRALESKRGAPRHEEASGGFLFVANGRSILKNRAALASRGDPHPEGECEPWFGESTTFPNVGVSRS